MILSSESYVPQKGAVLFHAVLSDKVVAAATAFIIFSAFNPYLYWAFEFSPYLKAISDVFFLLVVFMLAILGYLKNYKAFFVLPVLVLWALNYFHLSEEPYFDYISALKRVIQISFILLLSRDILSLAGHYFGKILAFFGFFSIVLWVIFVLFGDLSGLLYKANNPYPTKELIGQNYLSYVFGTFLDFLVRCYSGVCTFRVNAAFDEPGLWGTVCALYLVAIKLRVSHISDKIILVSGLLTFSLAFYVLLLVGVLSTRRISIFKFGLFFVVCALLVYFISPAFFDQFVIERLSSLGAGRTTAFFDVAVSQAFMNDELFFGFGFGEARLITDDASSWKVALYDSGLLGLSLMFTFFVVLYICYCFYGGDRVHGAVCCFILALSFYQRPEIVWVGYIFLLLYGFSSSKQTDN